jgi:hypothetical protein
VSHREPSVENIRYLRAIEETVRVSRTRNEGAPGHIPEDEPFPPFYRTMELLDI